MLAPALRECGFGVPRRTAAVLRPGVIGVRPPKLPETAAALSTPVPRLAPAPFRSCPRPPPPETPP